MSTRPAPPHGWPLARATLEPYALPLRRPWVSAQGEMRERRGWLLRLECESGLVGLGECAPLPAAGVEPLEAAWLEACCRDLPGQRLLGCLDRLPLGPPAARAALEGALLDLCAQAVGLPLRLLLAPGAASRVAVNAALGALDEGTTARAAEAIEAGYRVLKVKVGLDAPARELRLLERLAATLPEPVSLRLDANQAWKAADAATVVAGCAGLPVESLEEPLAEPTPESLARLQATAPFPLAADESLTQLDPAALFEARSVGRLVLKAPRLGGLQQALGLARRARAAGLECVVTTMVESAVGGWTAAHLAAAVDPEGRLTHGLATGEWLLRDLAAPPRPEQGWITLPATPGLGLSADT